MANVKAAERARTGRPKGAADKARRSTRELSPNAQRILELRLAYGLTQAALAEKMGMSEDTISAWERGRSNPPERSVKLAELVLKNGKKKRQSA
jgi:DNA-binding transcriptional regulator YiaG